MGRPRWRALFDHLARGGGFMVVSAIPPRNWRLGWPMTGPEIPGGDRLWGGYRKHKTPPPPWVYSKAAWLAAAVGQLGG